jgi:hypothetical protein
MVVVPAGSICLPLIAENNVLLPDCIKPSNATFKKASPSFYKFCTEAIIEESPAENKLFTTKAPTAYCLQGQARHKGSSDTLGQKSFVLGRNRVCKPAFKKYDKNELNLK